MTRRALLCRLDGLGDLVLAGPAIRALAASADHVEVLCGPAGAPAADRLPGVDAHVVFRCPWILHDPPPVDRRGLGELIELLAGRRYDEAVVLTSFHQSPLPTALVLRLAGVPRIGAISVDHPGALLDVRHHVDDDVHEVERSLSLLAAMGHRLPPGDDGRLRLERRPTGRPRGRTVVLHPGSTAPARRWSPEGFAAVAARLAHRGWDVVVTGSAGERDLVHVVAASAAVRAAVAPTFDELVALLAGAQVLVAGNTGPAHVAAAVGTPVVSLYAPTVPAVRWRPWKVPHRLLGDQAIECAGCRATVCPRPGHPCVAVIEPVDVVHAVQQLAPLAPRADGEVHDVAPATPHRCRAAHVREVLVP